MFIAEWTVMHALCTMGHYGTGVTAFFYSVANNLPILVEGAMGLRMLFEPSINQGAHNMRHGLILRLCAGRYVNGALFF